MLFHDIEERDRGFGVWRLWQELAAARPSFAFTHGHGLGIIAVGAVASAPVRELLEADAATQARVRERYEALGRVVSRQAELLAMPAEVESLHALVASLNDELSTQRDEIRQREQVDRGLPPEHELEDHPPGAGDRRAAASRRLTTAGRRRPR